MESSALTQRILPSEATAAQRQVVQQQDEAPSRKRQPPQGRGQSLSLPEDRVDLSAAAVQNTLQRSQAVSAGEKSALLGPQKLTRFSIYG